MPGHPSTLVELLDEDGVTWVNVTSRVRLDAGISLKRGRGDELEDVDAAEQTLTFQNDDGALTVGGSLGVYDEQPLRVTETVGSGGGAVTTQRFYGFVTGWPLEWPDPGARQCLVRVTAFDQQPRALRDTFDALIVEDTRALGAGPTAYYPMTEPAGSTSAGDVTSNAADPLALAGSGAAPVFGEPFAVPGGEDGTGVRFTGGRYLQSRLEVRGLDYMSVSAWFNTATTPPAGMRPVLLRAGGVTLSLDSSGKLCVETVGDAYVVGPVVNDGAPHHVFIRFSGVNVTDITVDGVNAPGPAEDPQDRVLSIGGYRGGTGWVGTIGHVATWLGLPLQDLEGHYARMMNAAPLSSSEWVAQLASYAGVDAPDGSPVVRGDAGVVEEVPLPVIGGMSPWEAMRKLQRAEGPGASVFVGRDGHVTLHNGHHRAYTSTGAPAMTIPSDDLHDDSGWPGVLYDRERLTNVAVVSRTGGAETTVMHEESFARRGAYPPPDDMTGLPLVDDAAAIRLGEWRVSKYGEPLPRMPLIVVDLLTATEAQQKAFQALELGDLVRLTGLPATAPWAEVDLIVEGINVEQTTDRWTASLDTSSADLFRAWILGDPVYGRLGVTTVPIY